MHCDVTAALSNHSDRHAIKRGGRNITALRTQKRDWFDVWTPRCTRVLAAVVEESALLLVIMKLGSKLQGDGMVILIPSKG